MAMPFCLADELAVPYFCVKPCLIRRIERDDNWHTRYIDSHHMLALSIEKWAVKLHNAKESLLSLKYI